MAIPNVNANVLGLVVVEWPQALIPTTIDRPRYGNVRLLGVAAMVTVSLVSVSLVTVALVTVALVLVAIPIMLLLVAAILVFLNHYLLVIVGLWRRIGALVAVFSWSGQTRNTVTYN